jgi:hypothetical protein
MFLAETTRSSQLRRSGLAREGALSVAEGYRAAGGPEAAAFHLETMLRS